MVFLMSCSVNRHRRLSRRVFTIGMGKIEDRGRQPWISFELSAIRTISPNLMSSASEYERSFLLRGGLVEGKAAMLIRVLKGAKVGMSKGTGKEEKLSIKVERGRQRLHGNLLFAAIQSSVVISEGRLPYIELRRAM
jgi:hypothetical protein